jgi:hypothetical protein
MSAAASPDKDTKNAATAAEPPKEDEKATAAAIKWYDALMKSQKVGSKTADGKQRVFWSVIKELECCILPWDMQKWKCVMYLLDKRVESMSNKGYTAPEVLEAIRWKEANLVLAKFFQPDHPNFELSLAIYNKLAS